MKFPTTQPRFCYFQGFSNYKLKKKDFFFAWNIAPSEEVHDSWGIVDEGRLQIFKLKIVSVCYTDTGEEGQNFYIL